MPAGKVRWPACGDALARSAGIAPVFGVRGGVCVFGTRTLYARAPAKSSELIHNARVFACGPMFTRSDEFDKEKVCLPFLITTCHTARWQRWRRRRRRRDAWCMVPNVPTRVYIIIIWWSVCSTNLFVPIMCVSYSNSAHTGSGCGGGGGC